jgi:glycosyltransferase involved in cell wall biosynthesis
VTARRRLLHVFATLGRGGPQLRAVQLIERMGGGFEHAVVAMDGDLSALDALPAGLAVERLPRPAARAFAGSALAFVRLLRARQPDLLLTYNWGAIEAVAAAWWLGIRAIVHHEDGFGPAELRRRHWRRNWLRRLLLGPVPVVIVPSENLLAIARAEWRLGARAQHLPNGVDVARFRPAPAAGAVPTDRARPFTIGTVGGLRGEKDHGVLLAALALMRRPARLLLVGDGPERAGLEARARDLGIAERVQFAGSCADPAPHYHAMDLFALSSRTEQMPISLLEAMASGLAVASTDVGDVRVMLPAACRGALVPPGDPAALARALDDLAADPQRRAREGAANRRKCVQRYELGACHERYVAVYERVLATANAKA